MTKFFIVLNLGAALLPGNPLSIGNWIVAGFLIGFEIGRAIDRQFSKEG
jgi:hypothetical protein